MVVMISQPMRGLTEEQVRHRRQKAEEYLAGCGHTVMDSVSSEAPKTQHDAVWCLGNALMKMSECDGVYFMKGWEQARGCRIEHEAAMQYGLWLMHEAD